MTPLYVDLDGSLTRCDTFYENALLLLKKKPVTFLRMPAWLMQGRAVLKEQVAKHATLNPADLSYNEELIEYLKEQKKAGRRLILATAAHELVAQAIVKHVPIFDDYIATKQGKNLSGDAKLQAIKERDVKFGYVGNASVDLSIWREASEAIVVNASPDVEKAAQKNGNVTKVFNDCMSKRRAIRKAMRIHQWSKNLLLFVPLMLTPNLLSVSMLLKVVWAFFSFSLTASAVYITNDLFDVGGDRNHPTKKNRPIARGDLSIPLAVMLAFLFFGAGIISSYFMHWRFFALVCTYAVITTLYSMFLKKIMMVDVITLALLYSARLIGGGYVCAIPLSFWLLSFFWFFFSSLALAKRSTELSHAKDRRKLSKRRRGYIAQDLSMINLLGVGFAASSIVVFSLYIDNPRTQMIYKHHQLLWATSLLLTYWLGRLWILTGRGEMAQDPIVFALKDRPTYFVGLAMLLLVVAAFGLKLMI